LVIPTAFIEALSHDAAVCFIGVANARGGTNVLTESIGAVALAIDARTAQLIVALSDSAIAVQQSLGIAPTISIPSTVLLWLDKRVRTTSQDVFVRSALEEADEAGHLIYAEMTEISRAFDTAGVSVHDLSTTAGSVVVDVAADTVRWLLDDGGYVVESAPLPLSTVRQIVAAGATLGLLGA
jgi:hypothetical protein